MCTYASPVDEHRGETSRTEHPTLAGSIAAPRAATPGRSTSKSFVKRIQPFRLAGQPKPVAIDARLPLDLCYRRSNKLTGEAARILSPGHHGRLQDQVPLD